MIPQRWEVGSFFPLVIGDERAPHTFADGQLFGSGRQAIAALLELGRIERGWTSVYVPTYYCPDVVVQLNRSIPVHRYIASPAGDFVAPDPGPTDVVLLVSYFGQLPGKIDRRCAATILDVTHDPIAPWICNFGADYVAASLRKTLPLPDGGVVWSPLGRRLPVAGPPDEQSTIAAAESLAAMCLKAGYLAGKPIVKDQYLPLSARAEERLARSQPSPMSSFSQAALATFPLREWRDVRLKNIATFADAIAPIDGIEVLPSTFGIVLRFESTDDRDRARAGLIENGVFPAILWDLNGSHAPARHHELSQQLLFLHADFRLDRQDIARMAGLLRKIHLGERRFGRHPGHRHDAVVKAGSCD